MRMYDVIMKKKRSEELSENEIRTLVSEYTAGKIPDYQMSAFLMAICLNGMSDRETYYLTDAISSSGDTVDLSQFGELSADKHSTGGVGDKTTLIVAPLAAHLGCKVAKMSGRGLGHTGGTVDKLESISGYNVSLSPDEFREQVSKIGLCVVGQSGNLAPADKKLYALRDVTATVDSIPLITSSIMGKKLASGSKNIVLDVKCGSGAFVKTPEDAEILAKNMVNIGNMCGRRTAAVITNMDVPLGFAVGNILEVREAVATLRGHGPDDLSEICVTLAALMAHLALGEPVEKMKDLANEALADGTAFSKFKEWISAQGGDTSLLDNTELFEKASSAYEIKATQDGFISKMDAEAIGLSAMELGAGRKTKEDKIDYAAGIILNKKTGDKVKRGDVLATLYTNRPENIAEAEKTFISSLSFSDSRIAKGKLIYQIIT
ncbi:MAG: pyrimidine-nucleoside phosphorylase [Ruminococcaceae bacterium]|nr:pyrimidine-nucleoside phosphorylase [Oscillospiraceae bacterium]